MNNQVLFVDDDINLLNGLKRHLRKHYQVETATGGADALAVMKDRGPFAVIVSDMQMPGMNGAEFLAESRRRFRDSIRIMLTGDAGQATAIKAVNSGEIFRFANKPCSMDTLRALIDAGIEQHRLITAERNVLTKTLGGSVGILTEILSLSNPRAFGRTAKIRALAKQICDRLPGVEGWEVELAAMLFPVGFLTLSEDLVGRATTGGTLTASEREEFESHAAVGCRLISKIPRLQNVAQIIAYQAKAFDGSGFPKDDISGKAIPIGARILKILIDFEAVIEAGKEEQNAAAALSGSQGKYDPDILEELNNIIGVDFVIKEVPSSKLCEGMLLESNLCSEEGEVLLARGHYVSSVILARLHDYMRSRPVRKTVMIREPLSSKQAAPEPIPQ